jgi:TRAP transporter TAXI family solute receptor
MTTRQNKGALPLLTSICLFLAFIFLAFPKSALSSQPVTTPPSKSVLPARISYSTHSVGTSNHAFGTALAKVASDHSGMMVVVSPTIGPGAWVPLMNKTGTPELGNASVLDAWWAYSGKITPKPIAGEPLGRKPFYETSSNLRILVAEPNFTMGILVRADSPFKSLRDMVGKRLGAPIGMPSSWAGVVADIYNAGCTPDQFVKVPVPDPTGAVRALMEGRVDGAHNSVGAPIVAEAEAMMGVRFLPGSTTPEDIKRANQVFPGGTYMIHKGGVPGVKEKIPLWTYPILCVTSSHLPDEVAYALVMAWTTYYREAWPLHPAMAGWEPKDMVLKTIPVPYHGGAIRLYKERGLWDPAMDKVQERLLKGEYPFLD